MTSLYAVILKQRAALRYPLLEAFGKPQSSLYCLLADSHPSAIGLMDWMTDIRRVAAAI